MDLALEIGWPVFALKRAMPERELRQWLVYRNRRQLPQFRVEMYLAQICMVIAQAMGSGKATIDDFILDFDSTDASSDSTAEAEDVDLDELKAEFGFKPAGRKYGS